MTTKLRKRDHQRVVKTAKRSAFWQGVVEGFGGPALMGHQLKVPVKTGDQYIIGINWAHDKPVSGGWRIGYILSRATERIADKKGLSSYVRREKRLDRSGKLQDFEVVVVKPRQVHGESQE